MISLVHRLGFHLVLGCMVLLVGCAVESVTPPPTTTSNPASNWQIQLGTSITSPPTLAFPLQGAMQVQGSQVTGVFSGTPLCGEPQVLNFAGTIDSMGNLTIASKPAYFVVQLAVPADPTVVSNGTMGVTGQFCALAMAPAPAVGVEVAPLTGTFTGPVTSSGSNGNFSMTLTQSGTPNASGQFPLTGSVTFSSGVCVESTLAPMSGTVSGVGMTLATQNIRVVASTNPAATQLSATSIVFPPGSCANGTYTGTLTRQ